MTREEKRALWGQRISSYKASGLNAEQWCSIHDLPLATLRYWLGRQNVSVKETPHSFRSQNGLQ